ncbi:MAG: hypothetical protein LLG09_02865 [Negativicutes bacterium]|nr:hypothetical protein [Negativicutes bacterium]
MTNLSFVQEKNPKTMNPPSKRKPFLPPVAEITYFSAEDVIVASGPDSFSSLSQLSIHLDYIPR